MPTLSVREAVVTAMKAAAPLTALIPADSMYGERVPADRAFPFSRLGNPELTPFRMACHNGQSQRVTVHGFFKAPSNDDAARFHDLAKQVFDGTVLDLDGDETVEMTYLGGFVLSDPDEQDGWHAVVDFEAA